MLNDIISASVFLGVFITLGSYFIALKLREKTGLAVLNPLLVAVILTIAFLIATGTPYAVYNEGAKYVSYLLTPATVCLAIPLYEQLGALKRNYRAIAAGIVTGVLTSLLSVLALALVFGLGHREYVTFLPKSVTSAIGMGISSELGGYTAITVAVIILTGIIGNIIATPLCRLLKIKEPVAVGVAIGSASHAIGTVRAMEMGPVEGAMSSLSIALSGILTVFGAMIFQNFI
ncbi:MAG: LrgB family protein [Firmicutes bacterium]|nr:LrgB family protein [Bacillota bacterium]